MNVLAYYADRMESIAVDGKTAESVLVLRRGKSESATVIGDGKIMVTENSTAIDNGDLVTRGDGQRYFIVAKQSSADCTQMQGKRVNAMVQIVELVDTYVNHRKTGTTATVTASDVPVHYLDVSANMKLYDAGLLPKTVKRVLLKSTVPVKLLSRIVLNQRNYQVDNIDTAKYVGLYEVQVSEDTR